MALDKAGIGACVVVVWALGCSAPPPPDAPKVKPDPVVEEVQIPDGTIDRGSLELVLRHGPPWLLQRVPIEEVLEKGKFIGWRVQELPSDWIEWDLQPGDVVTSVNTLPLETPTDFWAAWTTLSVASELKVSYLRDGEKLELAIPIHGVPNPTIANEMQRRPEQREEVGADSPVRANQKYSKPKQYDTIVIEGPKQFDTDTMVDWSN